MPDEPTKTPSLPPEDASTSDWLKQRAALAGAEPSTPFDFDIARRTAAAANGNNGSSPEDSGEAPTDADTQAATDTPNDDGANSSDGQSAEDGDGEPGDKPGDTGKSKEDLPVGIKKRLNRQRKQSERRITRLQKEVAELKAQLAGQQGATNPEPEQKKEPEPEPEPAAAEDTPTDDDDASSEAPYPELTDYESEEAWLEDIENWEEGKPLNRKPKEQEPQAKDEPQQEPEPQQPVSDADRRRQERSDLLRDLEEAMDDWDDAPEDLSDSFFESLQQAKIHLSDTMLNYMADSDNGAQIAAKFLESPRQSRRIARIPTANAQVQAMERLLNEKKSNSRKGGTPSSAPNIEPLSAGGNTITRPKSLEETESTSEYLAARRQVAAKSGGALFDW